MSPTVSEYNPFTLTSNSHIENYLQENKKWAARFADEHPGVFEINGKGQDPHTLFIGCSDSRYNEAVVGVLPGEVFTYKNIANRVNTEEVLCLATLEFAINVLKVNKVVICGHTDCGGIKTCLTNKREALPSMKCSHLHEYLQDIDDLYHENKALLAQPEYAGDLEKQSHLLSVLNVKRQYERLVTVDTVKEALASKSIEIYGLLYNVNSGLLDTVEL